MPGLVTDIFSSKEGMSGSVIDRSNEKLCIRLVKKTFFSIFLYSFIEIVLIHADTLELVNLYSEIFMQIVQFYGFKPTSSYVF